MNSALLEVPSRLAYVFTRLHEWVPPHTEQNITTVAGDVPLLNLSLQLPKDINAFPFSKFANQYFKHNEWQARQEPIKSPFLAKRTEAEVKDSLMIFRLILKFTADLSLSADQQWALAAYVVEMALRHESLRDEVYCQLVNQTWLSRDAVACEKAWLLMATCLSCFAPSTVLAKYLLKYVSDHAVNGYKAFCQHKLLLHHVTGSDNESQLTARHYPPSRLELQAAARKQCMAVEVHLTNGDKTLVQVESLTTIEDLCSHLLKSRRVTSGTSGWNLSLIDSGHVYEADGSAYVLDLLAEMDIPPGFPAQRACFLVKNSFPDRHGRYAELPHDPMAVRTETVDVSELIEPVPVRRVSQRVAIMRQSSSGGLGGEHRALRDEMLANSSALNARKTQVDPALSKTSMLNVRYTSHMTSDPSAGVERSKFAVRGGGSVQGSDAEDLGDWVDETFAQVLNANVDDLTSPQAVSRRIRGIGDNMYQSQPGLAAAYAGSPYATSNFNYSAAPVLLSPVGFSGPPIGSIPLGSMNYETAAAVLAQQQAAEQAQLAQQLASQQLQQQQLSAQIVQQQAANTAKLQVELQKQRMEAELLQQQVQTELMRQQLKVLQADTRQPATVETESKRSPMTTGVRKTTATKVRQSQQSDNEDDSEDAAPAPVPVSKVAVNGAARTGVKFSEQSNDYDKEGAVPSPPAIKKSQQPPALSKSANKPGTFATSASSGKVNGSSEIKATVKKNESSEKPSVSSGITSELGTVREIRRGRVQWPPAPPTPSEEDKEKLEANANKPKLVGKITIVENKNANKDAGAVSFSKENQEKVSAMLQAHREAANTGKGAAVPRPKSVVDQSHVPIDMQSRIDLLARNLGVGALAPEQADKEVADINHASPTPLNQLPPPNTLPPPRINPKSPPPADDVMYNIPRASIAEPQQHRYSTVYEGEEILRSQPVPRLNLARSPSPYQPPVMAPARQSMSPRVYEDPTYMMERAVRSPKPLDMDVMDSKPGATVHTVLYAQSTGPFLTYQHTSWQLNLRKEVFRPLEKVNDPALVTLIFNQIVQDAFSETCIRLNREEKLQLRQKLDSFGLTWSNYHTDNRQQVKRIVIDYVRDMPLYFSRLFHVKGGRRWPEVELLAVSHHGIVLARRATGEGFEFIKIIEEISFDNVDDVSVPAPCTLQIHVEDRYIIVYSTKAWQIKDMIESYCIEAEKDVLLARVVKPYMSDSQPQIIIVPGDIVRLTSRHAPAMEEGYYYGEAHGVVGLIPADCLLPMSKLEAKQRETPVIAQTVAMTQAVPRVNGTPASGDTVDGDVDKLSMMEFAMYYFRESPFKDELKPGDKSTLRQSIKLRLSKKLQGQGKEGTWRDIADLIKWSQEPIRDSLLKLESNKLSKNAVELYKLIMQYMGDLRFNDAIEQEHIPYHVLAECKKYPELIDEVYCHLIKQTTNNRSVSSTSCLLGWRMLHILTAYLYCSDCLRPYFYQYLRNNADPKMQFHNLATMCHTNLQATYKYGGRKVEPSRIELANLTHGRGSKRQAFVTSGARVIWLNISISTVAADAINDLWDHLDMSAEQDKDEYGVFYVIEQENNFSQLRKDDYILDVCTNLARRKKTFHFLFQRTSWVCPINTNGSDIYIEMMYNQCVPDFIEGYLLTHTSSYVSQQQKDDVVQLAALKLRADGVTEFPQSVGEVRRVLPQNLEAVTDMKIAALCKTIGEVYHSHARLSHIEAKRKFLALISKWPFFGSVFFPIRNVNDARVRGSCWLAVNKNGVHIIDNAHLEVVFGYELKEVVARQVSTANQNVLELTFANRQVLRLVTDQAVDIMLLIRQHVHLLAATDRPATAAF